MGEVYICENCEMFKTWKAIEKKQDAEAEVMCRINGMLPDFVWKVQEINGKSAKLSDEDSYYAHGTFGADDVAGAIEGLQELLKSMLEKTEK